MTDPADVDAPRTPEEWGEAFEELRPTYEELARRLEQLLEHLLADEGLEYAYAWHTSLSVTGLVERMYARRRNGTPVTDPLAEFSDLARVTIVTPTKDGVGAICALVGREFDVDPEASLDPGAADLSNLDPARHDRVVYDFPRFVVSLPEGRHVLPEWHAYDGMRAQINVQTGLQQQWELLYDDRPFTSDRYHPTMYREALARAAGLFRDVDEQLLEVSRSLATAEEEARRAIANGDADVRLDGASLTAYLLESDVVKTLVRLAEHAGMRQDAYPDEVAWHEDHLWLLHSSGHETTLALDEFLRASEPRAAAILTSLTDLARDGDFVPIATAEDVVSWLTLVLTRADAQSVELSRWRGSIESALNTVIGNPTEEGLTRPRP